jgi:hypothetical protein
MRITEIHSSLTTHLLQSVQLKVEVLFGMSVRFFKAFGKRASFGFFPAHADRCRQIVHFAEQQVQPFAEALTHLHRGVLGKTP